MAKLRALCAGDHRLAVTEEMNTLAGVKLSHRAQWAERDRCQSAPSCVSRVPDVAAVTLRHRQSGVSPARPAISSSGTAAIPEGKRIVTSLPLVNIGRSEETSKAAAVSTGIVNDNAPSDPRYGSQFSSPPMVLLAAQIVGMLPMNKTINRVKVRSIPCGKYVRRG